MKKSMIALTVCFLLCVVLGFREFATAQHEQSEGEAITKAVAVLFPTKGNDVRGRVTFTPTSEGVHVHAVISGLSPGEHGFHIHEFGVWSEDGLAAGSHYNPTKAPHAGPHSPRRHIGDLGNVTANANGIANYDLDDLHLSLHGHHSIIGRGVIVHEKADDLKTQQPPGNAGGRLAVGVIGVAKP
jgi:Cu-Zn family superoxide dismutase